MRIDLVWIGPGEPPEWHLGSVIRASPSPRTLGPVVEEHLSSSSADAVLHWGLPIPPPDAAWHAQALASVFDVWHIGLLLGAGGLPESASLVTPTWMFMRDPDERGAATSWRLSLTACLTRSQVIRQLGHVDPRFTTLLGASLEAGHRWISSGAFIRHDPSMLSGAEPPPLPRRTPLPIEDEVLFVGNRFGVKWAAWAAARLIATGRPVRGLAAASMVLRHRELGRAGSYQVRPTAPPATGAVSVLIPTLDRYPYLHVVLRQLAEQSVKPEQVIVVDQTPAERREDDIEVSHPSLPLEVLVMDRPGQSTARNAGLRRATGEFVLFLDDDDEIPSDLIERHLSNLGSLSIDASCGVAVEPGGTLPQEFRVRRMSGVFPTNNTMLRRSMLARSGGFDLAFDRGPRADHDLGMRVYLAGGTSLSDPQIEVLHHRAPSGGLRTIGARVTTYAGSRKGLVERHHVAPTEIYLAKRYFSEAQVRESLALRRWGTLATHERGLRRVLRVVVQLALMPNTVRQVRASVATAQDLLLEFPIIPAVVDRDEVTADA